MYVYIYIYGDCPKFFFPGTHQSLSQSRGNRGATGSNRGRCFSLLRQHSSLTTLFALAVGSIFGKVEEETWLHVGKGSHEDRLQSLNNRASIAFQSRIIRAILENHYPYFTYHSLCLSTCSSGNPIILPWSILTYMESIVYNHGSQDHDYIGSSRHTNRQPIAQPIAMQGLAIAQNRVNTSNYKFVICIYGRLPYIITCVTCVCAIYIYKQDHPKRPYPNIRHSFSWKRTAFEAPLRVPEDSSQAPEVLGGEIGIHQRLESGLDPAVGCCWMLFVATTAGN